jgi:hydroxymethylpyrimidine/phosphomethylpyrimidine kinase
MVQALPAELVLAQVRAVLSDIRVDSVKVGMLGTVEVTMAVAQALSELPGGVPVVVDPVMVSESGARLLDPDAQRALIEEILPRATVLTPNLPEARALAGAGAPPESGPSRPTAADDAAVAEAAATATVTANEDAGDPEEEAEVEALARAVLALGPRIVVLTGGHRRRVSDLFIDSGEGGRMVSIEGERHPEGAAHGSGCTHSSVLAAQLALGRSPLVAARRARVLAGEAVGRGLREVGAGPGPVDVIDLEGMRGN